jgi:hypothetical protein
MSINDFLSRATKRKKKQSEIKEVHIEEEFCEYAKSLGCKALKLILLNKRGFPDRTVLCPKGRILFIEFKKKGKKLNPTQVPVKKLIVSFGFEYHVCDEKGQAESILDEFLEW